MTADAKSKAAANLLRLGFIDVFLLVLGFPCLHLRGASFGSRTNVFLLDKAETAVETRQVFYRVAVGDAGCHSPFSGRSWLPQIRGGDGPAAAD
jgi:hypothetical protein